MHCIILTNDLLCKLIAGQSRNCLSPKPILCISFSELCFANFNGVCNMCVRECVYVCVGFSFFLFLSRSMVCMWCGIIWTIALNSAERIPTRFSMEEKIILIMTLSLNCKYLHCDFILQLYFSHKHTHTHTHTQINFLTINFISLLILFFFYSEIETGFHFLTYSYKLSLNTGNKILYSNRSLYTKGTAVDMSL